MTQMYAFTFPTEHPLCDCVQLVHGKDESEARQLMARHYGTHWAFCYGPDKYTAGKGRIVVGSMPFCRLHKELGRPEKPGYGDETMAVTGGDTEKRDRVYILQLSYKGTPPENVGLYDSPAALVTGLSTSVAASHQGENIMKVARAVGLAVYDFVTAAATQPGEKLPPSDRAVCRDRDAMYFWESDVVRRADRDQEGAEAESSESGKEASQEHGMNEGGRARTP